MANWTFLSNHRRALPCITHDRPRARVISPLSWTSLNAAPMTWSMIFPRPVTSASSGKVVGTVIKCQGHMPPEDPDRMRLIGEVLQILTRTPRASV